MDMEYKTSPLEFKTDEDGQISGYAAIFNTKDQGGDIIDPKAFDNFLASKANPVMLWQHNPREPIGVWTKAEKDKTGLMLTGNLLTDLQKGAEARTLLKAKAISGLSIGYRTKQDRVTEEKEDGDRVILDLELWETSVVTFPMHLDAQITDVKELTSIRDVERVLRDGGVPSSFAKLVAAFGYDEAQLRLKNEHREGDDFSALAEAVRGLQTTLQGMKG